MSISRVLNVRVSGLLYLNSEVMGVDEEIRGRIRQEMGRKGLTQRDLAKRLGVSPPALSQIISGKRGTMPDSLLDVLNALDLTLKAVPKDSTGAGPEALRRAAGLLEEGRKEEARALVLEVLEGEEKRASTPTPADLPDAGSPAGQTGEEKTGQP